MSAAGPASAGAENRSAGGLPVRFLYLVFTVSGVAGLIYEAVWARYLKLFLGNDAYAQALVLAIFLGGLALGAALAGRLSSRIPRPLLAYACVEGVVALLAIIFHPVFVGATRVSFESVAPWLANPTLIEIYKWLLGGLLLLPQAVLLGATFPLLAAGVARSRPADSGRVLAWLYFTNSLGGACGVLLNGFLLVPWFGLPGAVLMAGLLNALVGLAVALTDRLFPASSSQPLDGALPKQSVRLAPWLCLLAAAVTGAASLVYEIAWVRLLALVLGSSNHAFELMLSAFILGLALGGFFIRNRVDKLKNPLFTLGVIQLVMGALAAATLFFYREVFLLMGWLLQALQRSDPGYLIFQIGSHAIALVVMLPATICAGMTLPILTWYQLAGEGGERAIGRTYAANTLGSIVAVFTAVHLLLPGLGVKGALLTGAALDLVLGAWLVSRAMQPAGAWYHPRRLAGAVAATAVLLLGILIPQLDSRVLASGLFQNARTQLPEFSENHRILYHKDGKTSALTVTESNHGDGITTRGFLTSGKGNGGLFLDQSGERVSADEPSFGLVGLLPLAFKPDAARIACIGLGTGLTAHAALASPKVEQLDVIEIEKRTVESAAFFQQAVPRALGDPRSQVHIADAKTFFASRPERRYDVVLSNPSNLWVSGVSGLFTREFYQVVARALEDDGLLMQWISLYTTDVEMVASVVAALDVHFEDYALYLGTDNDLLIVAWKKGQAPPLSPKVFEYEEARPLLARYGIESLDDFQLRFVGDRSTTRTYFDLFETPANSDYFPLLESRSLRAFYLRQRFQPFRSWQTRLSREFHAQAERPADWRPATAKHFRKSILTHGALTIRDHLLEGAPLDEFGANPPLMLAQVAPLAGPACPENLRPVWLNGVTPLLNLMLLHGGEKDLRRVWQHITTRPCSAGLREVAPESYDLFQALALQDHEQVVALWERTRALAPPDANLVRVPNLHFLIVAASEALYELERYDEVLQLFHWVSERGGGGERMKHALFYIVARTLDAQSAAAAAAPPDAEPELGARPTTDRRPEV